MEEIMTFGTETIAAISTNTMGNGGIGIVRISGENAFNVAQKIFVSKKNSDALVEQYATHTLHYGTIVHNDKVIDVLCKESYKNENRFYADNGILEFQEAACRFMKKVYNIDNLTSDNECFVNL